MRLRNARPHRRRICRHATSTESLPRRRPRAPEHLNFRGVSVMAASKGRRGQDTAPQQQAKERPVQVIRIRNLRANIWANRLPSGDLAYNVTFDRLYREPDQTDAQGEVTNRGEWKQSQSFGKDDLLLLAKLADLAHTEVYRLRDESREQTF